MKNIIIAGGRDFRDYELMKRQCVRLLQGNTVTILSGTAMGADKLGQIFAAEFGHDLALYPADWDSHGKAAGPIRNKKMADDADGLIAFWDGASKGTMHMINIAKTMKIPNAVIYY